ncbi:MAG: SDR family NAD(P)-dependent oxidoreductase [Bacteroidia bacterium]
MKTAIVTGASSGMGKVTAKYLAKEGYHTILVARNKLKAQSVQTEILQSNPHAKVDLLIADLSDINQLKSLANEILHHYQQIDVLVNNAGAYFGSRKESKNGIELTLATNHIPYYYLTKQLIPLLTKALKARVVFVASEAHNFAKPNLDNLQLKQGYKPMLAYANSKLYNIITCLYFAREFKQSNILFNAMHPGGVNTGFAKDAKGMVGFIFRVLKFMLRTPEKGADTILWLATGKETLNYNGKYFYDRKQIKAQSVAYDVDFQKRLILLTEDLINNAS